MDSLHIASAIHAKADVLFTLDGVRDSKGRRRNRDLTEFSGKIGNPPLTIEGPFIDIGPLFPKGVT